MDTLVIESPSKSDVRVIPNFERSPITFAKTKTERVLDAHYKALTNQILSGHKPSLNFEMVEEALAAGRVSKDVINDMEDAMFGLIMTENLDDDEYVSEEEIMKILDE